MRWIYPFCPSTCLNSQISKTQKYILLIPGFFYLSSVFLPYLVFCQSNLSKVNFIWKVTSMSTTFMKMNIPSCFHLHAYIHKFQKPKHLSCWFPGFDLSLVFLSYLVFCHSNLSKVNFIWKVTSMSTTFMKKNISNSVILGFKSY
jgi:uncharacterized protein YjbI with pentapeptide repeats